jgi:hypothetical protein
MGMGMGGAITAVAAITMVGIGATTMAGGIITIGGDFLTGAFLFVVCAVRPVLQNVRSYEKRKRS